jgi:glycosyltransferase involved in cell wall biosynthesis
MLKNYRDTHAGQKWKTIAYVPLDGDIIHTHDIIDLAFLDALIAYHGESTNQFSLALNNLYKSKLIDHIPSLQSIYHGVDTGIFNIDDIHQNAWRLHAKHILFNHLDRWESSIIVLNANRFNERKDLYTTLAGFSEARNHTDRHLYLCMHMPAIEPFQLDILNGWISTLNLDDHIIINPLGNGKFVSDEKLCLLYRACEIGVNTSLGEGWGLVSFEHAACGAIQILPRHAGLEEIWKDNAEYIEIEENIKLPSNPFMMHRASASHLATILANLCNNPDYLQARSKASFDHVNGDEFDWVVIAKKWQSLLMEYC